MKKSIKRTLSFCLALMLLLSIAPIGQFQAQALTDMGTITTIPTEYDARKVGVVTPVKDYGNFPTTDYAFATISAIESSLISQKLADKSIDLSEAALIYSTDTTVPKGGLTGALAGIVGVDTYDIATPKKDNIFKTEFPVDVALTAVAAQEHLTSESAHKYSLTNLKSMQIAVKPDTNYGLNSWKSLQNETEIKKAIIEQGSVIATIRFDKDKIKRITDTHYLMSNVDSNVERNHSVVIIGWNTKEWLVKDSMGSSIGANGYYYIPISSNKDGDFIKVVARVWPYSYDNSTRMHFSTASPRGSEVYEFNSDTGYVGIENSQGLNNCEFIWGTSFYFSESTPYEITASVYIDQYFDNSIPMYKLPLTRATKIASNTITTDGEGYYTISFPKKVIPPMWNAATMFPLDDDYISTYAVVLEVKNLSGENARFPVESIKKAPNGQKFNTINYTLCSEDSISWISPNIIDSQYQDFPILMHTSAELPPEKFEIHTDNAIPTISVYDKEIDLSKIGAYFYFDNYACDIGQYSYPVPKNALKLKTPINKQGIQDITIQAEYLYNEETIIYEDTIQVNVVAHSDIFDTKACVAKVNFISTGNGHRYFTNIQPGLKSLDGKIVLKDGYSYEIKSNSSASNKAIGTGDKILINSNSNVSSNSFLIDYEILIYGDVNGDGWYDKSDAVMVQKFISGELGVNNSNRLNYMACDANRDNKINQDDIDLLNKADSLLKQVNKANPSSTQEEYNEYLACLSQSESKKPSLWEKIIDFFMTILEFFGIRIR